MEEKLEKLLEKLESYKQRGQNTYMAKCPCHKDENPSLSITMEKDKILLNCFGGCNTENILNKLGLKMSDLFLNDTKVVKPKIVEAEYPYLDENGEKLYKAIRYKGKKFQQAKYYNGKWIYNMEDVKYVPYNLPNVLKSNIIYFVEGEKDADNLNSIGLTATTTVGGANSFKKRALDYCKYLKDKEVYIIPDNDKSGYKYAEDIKKSLDGIAKKVKILKLTDEIKNLKEKADISDVISDYGTKETLEIIHKLQNAKYNDTTLPINTATILTANDFNKVLDFLGIKIRFNLITKRISIDGMPEKYAKSDLFEILPIYIKDVFRNNGMKPALKTIEEYILLKISENNFNPFVDFLKSHKWDGQDRISEIYSILHLENPLYKTLVKKWLYQTVCISFNTLDNPFGVEGILTLQGKQGIGKTRFFSLLSIEPEWFADGVTIDVNNKDTLIKATSKLICELGEVDSTIRKEQSALKAFVTSAEDDIRPPYGKKSIRRARNTSFCATVNPEVFLKDATGNRRFWVVPVTEIDHKRLENYGKDWVKQLWLQVYDEVKNNLQCFRLTGEERAELEKNNLKFTEFLPFEEELLQRFDFKSKIKYRWTAQELIEHLGFNTIPQVLGKSLRKIQSIYPELIDIKRTNTSNIYSLPIKKEATKNTFKQK